MPINNDLPYKLETVPCPLCGSKDYSVHIKDAKDLYNHCEGTFNLVKCEQCSFIFTNPRPTRDTISYFYPDEAGYYKPASVGELEKPLTPAFIGALNNHFSYQAEGASVNKLISALYYLTHRQKFYERHITPWVPAGKLLDIGCSWGGWLHTMKKIGWDVYGLDLNEAAVAHAKGTLNLDNIQTGMIEDSDFEENSFDTINMNMVLEHVHQPLDVLKSVNKLLKSNGTLTLSIPDISGFSANKFDRYAYTLHVPAHLNHFSPETIRVTLEKSGFKTVRIVHHKGHRDFIESARNKGSKGWVKLLKFSPVKNLLVKPFFSVLAKLGKTSRMTVYAQKL